MVSKHKLICWSCKNEISLTGRATRTDACPKCDNPIKCCYNCRFYDRDAHHQCLETQAEWVRYKEKANFCEYFAPKPLQPAGTQVAAGSETNNPEPNDKLSLTRQNKARVFTSKKEKDKAAWDSLFKD